MRTASPGATRIAQTRKILAPHFVFLRSRHPFAFAGLWWPGRQQTGQASPVCTILTCAANELVAPIHDRMSVILRAPERDQWLDPSAEVTELERVLVPLAAVRERFRISRR